MKSYEKFGIKVGYKKKEYSNDTKLTPINFFSLHGGRDPAVHHISISSTRNDRSLFWRSNRFVFCFDF